VALTIVGLTLALTLGAVKVAWFRPCYWPGDKSNGLIFTLSEHVLRSLPLISCCPTLRVLKVGLRDPRGPQRLGRRGRMTSPRRSCAWSSHE